MQLIDTLLFRDETTDAPVIVSFFNLSFYNMEIVFNFFLPYFILILKFISFGPFFQGEKQKFVCITNYTAQSPDEVSVNEGDMLEILDDVGMESSMVCVIPTGAVGWLPRVFIMRASEEDVKKAPKTAKGKEREALNQRE